MCIKKIAFQSHTISNMPHNPNKPTQINQNIKLQVIISNNS